MVAVRSTQCFSRKQLTEFAAGSVSVDQLDSMANHVDTCPACQATISGLDDQPDSFVRDLRQLPHDSMVEESACEAVIRQLVDRHAADVARPREPQLPDLIGGYRVLESLGAGGMGVVYKAQHPKLKRLVAIKLLPMQSWAGPAAVARFEREMEVSGGMDHPNIVRASDAGEESGMQYLVMDFVDGLDLSRLVRRMGLLPVAEACEIVRQAACGLAHVHGCGLVHRDIKPSNIMVTREGQVKVLDLGLAMLGEQYLEGENNLTTIGQLMGTLDYMAPEQAADSHQVDVRADVYSLGATLFHMLTGRAPYGGPKYNSLLKKVVALANAPVPSAAATRDELPPKLETVIAKCLAKDPQERYASVEEVANALAPFSQSADLQRLMQTAATQPEPHPAHRSAWSIAAVFGQATDMPKGRHKPAAAGGGNRFRSLVQLLGAAAAFALIALGVIVVRIATDRGELIVRSSDPNARLLIKRADGQAVKEMTVEKGRGKTTIRSGEYAVELLSNTDRMMIDKQEFKLLRGGEVVLTVQERPARPGSGSGMEYGVGMGGEYGGSEYGGDMGGGMTLGMGGSGPKAAADQGTSAFGMGMDAGTEMYSGRPDIVVTKEGYDASATMEGYDYGPAGGGYGTGSAMETYGLGGGGSGLYGYPTPRESLKDRLVYNSKTYNQWMRILATERNPEQLEDAVKAITVLAPEVGSEEAATALLRIMRAYATRGQVGREMAFGKLGSQVMQSLFSLEPTEVAQAILQEITRGNTNSRQFLDLLVSSLPGADVDSTASPLATALKQVAPEIIAELVKLSDSKDRTLSLWAVHFAADLTANLKLDIDQSAQLRSLLTEALDAKDPETVARVARALGSVAPETDGLAEALLRLTDHPAHRSLALETLGQLGPRAKIALPKLIEVLDQAAKTSSAGYDGGYGMGSGYSEEDMGTGEEMGGGMMGGMEGGYGMMGGSYDTDVAVRSALRAIEQMKPQDAAEAIPLLQKLSAQGSPYRAAARRVLKKLENPGDPD